MIPRAAAALFHKLNSESESRTSATATRAARFSIANTKLVTSKDDERLWHLKASYVEVRPAPSSNQNHSEGTDHRFLDLQ